jgi:hypothetical protein
MHPSCLANSESAKNLQAEGPYLLTFVRSHRHYSFCLRLFAYGYTTLTPTSSGSKPAPYRHLGSGMRPEKVLCMELSKTLTLSGFQ